MADFLKYKFIHALINVFMIVSSHHVFGWNANFNFDAIAFSLQDSFATLF